MFTVSFKGRDRLFHHVDIFGSQDGVEDDEDGAGVERDIAGGLFNDGREDLKSDLDVTIARLAEQVR